MPEAQLKRIEFPFPFRGVHEVSALSEQPPGTTPYARNVRGYDVRSECEVGCQRTGSAKLAAATQYATTSIDALATGFFSNYGNVEEVIYLQSGRAYVGTILGGQAVISQGTNSTYTVGTNSKSITAGFGAFWLVDGVLPLRRILPSNPLGIPAATAGSIPAPGTILALYRGRLFHAGFYSDPYNYIASRSGDPLDYDFAALDQAGAFAGNDTPQAGLIGDRITAMIPYGDVSMVMGMAGSIALMRGDPKAGGDLAFLSREVGIISNTAWARSPDGTLYFMAADGLYRMSAPGTVRGLPSPEAMSKERLNATLGNLDFSSISVVMSWDPLEWGVRILLVPSDHTKATTAVIWSQRKDAFWIDTIPAAKAPVAMAVANSGRLLLQGGYDGWLRTSAAGSLDDDGTGISSLVQFASVVPFGENVQAKVISLRNLWGNQSASFNAVWGIKAGTDPVTVYNQAAPAMSGTVTAGGYSGLIRTRARGSCLQFSVSNTVSGKTWLIEMATALVAPSGRVRA